MRRFSSSSAYLKSYLTPRERVPYEYQIEEEPEDEPEAQRESFKTTKYIPKEDHIESEEIPEVTSSNPHLSIEDAITDLVRECNGNIGVVLAKVMDIIHSEVGVRTDILHLSDRSVKIEVSLTVEILIL
jgi:hypothetical protein